MTLGGSVVVTRKKPERRDVKIAETGSKWPNNRIGKERDGRTGKSSGRRESMMKESEAPRHGWTAEDGAKASGDRMRNCVALGAAAAWGLEETRAAGPHGPAVTRARAAEVGWALKFAPYGTIQPLTSSELTVECAGE
ncbi:hypothetical protein FGB62_9g22 [Gracilaria domingensis]|nr:hypothetical protein FGB62_9g22 [Gracilaria domingensis]